MKSATSEMGIDKPTKDEIEDILKDLDDDGDGRLTVREF